MTWPAATFLVGGLITGLLLLVLTPVTGLAQASDEADPAAPAIEETGDETSDETSDETNETDDETRVVTRARRPAASADTTGSAEFVEGEAVREAPQASLVEALSQRVPGLYVSSRGAGVHGIGAGASGGLVLRGLGSLSAAQTLVVLDGVPDYQGLFGHPLPDSYVPTLIDHVAVVPGGDSVRFGSNAAAGLLLVNSRWRGEPGWEVAADAGWGSFSTARLQAAVLGATAGTEQVASFYGYTTEGHRPGAGGTTLASQGGVRARLGDTTATARLRYARITGADPGPLSFPTPQRWYEAERAGLSLTLARDLSAGLEGQLVGWAQGGRNRLWDGFHSLDGHAGGDLRLRWHPSSQVAVRPGFSLEWIDGSARNPLLDAPLPSIESVLEVAPHLETTWSPWRWLLLEAGARLILGTEPKPVGVWKAGAALFPWKGGTLRARVSSNYRRPTLRERYLPFPVASPDLRPERVRTSEVGWDQWLLDRRLSTRLSLWRTDARDLIKSFGFFPRFEVLNIDRATFVGVEALVTAIPTPSVELYAGGSATDTGRYTQQNPSHRLVGGARWSPGPLSLAVDGQWVGGLFMGNYGRDPLADVVLLDARVAWDFGARWPTVYLEGRNLLDRRQAFLEGYPLPGLHVFAGASIELE